jgi:hypothetical protein
MIKVDAVFIISSLPNCNFETGILGGNVLGRCRHPRELVLAALPFVITAANWDGAVSPCFSYCSASTPLLPFCCDIS